MFAGLILSSHAGRVCVPVNPAEVDHFDPASVPTVGQLLRELDRPTTEGTGEEAGGSPRVKVSRPDYDRTSLKPFVEMFERHVSAIIKERMASKKGRENVTMEF